MLCGGCPTRVSEETPAASCSALPHTGDRIGSSLCLGTDQSSWLTRADVAVGSFASFWGLYPTERHRSAVPQIPVITRPEMDIRVENSRGREAMHIATVLRLQEADHRHLPSHALLPVRGPSRRDPTHPRSCIRPQASAICPRSRPRSRCRSCDVPAPADIRSRPDRTRRASLRTAASI